MDIALNLISNKWTIQIVRELLSGPKRPLELERSLKGISAKTLAERLYALQSAGLITRVSFPEVPPRVEYSLTTLGREMEILMHALKVFGERWMVQLDVHQYEGAGCERCLMSDGDREACPAVADMTFSSPVRKTTKKRANLN